MAACSASMLAKGRAAQARSAIHGECSKMSPRWPTNWAWGMAERAARAAPDLTLRFMPLVILESILDGCALGVPGGDQFAFVVGDAGEVAQRHVAAAHRLGDLGGVLGDPFRRVQHHPR